MFRKLSIAAKGPLRSEGVGMLSETVNRASAEVLEVSVRSQPFR